MAYPEAQVAHLGGADTSIPLRYPRSTNRSALASVNVGAIVLLLCFLRAPSSQLSPERVPMNFGRKRRFAPPMAIW